MYRLDPRVKILLSVIVTTVAAITTWWISAIMLASVLYLTYTGTYLGLGRGLR